MINFDRMLTLFRDMGIETPRLKVFVYMVTHVNPKTKRIHVTLDRIAKETNVSMSTVEQTVRRMQSLGAVKNKKNGVWEWTGFEITPALEDDLNGDAEYEEGIPIIFKSFV